ncbi:MAG: ABC transporter substrate-binding protein [Eubacteriales bacterium]
MKKSALAVLFIIIISLFMSCVKDEVPEDSSFVMGFSQLGRESGWRLGNTQSILNAAEDAGIDLIYLNAEQEYENQIGHIRRFIANQVDIIVFAPIYNTGWDNVLQEAYDAGIPVVIIDRGITVENDDLYTAFIGSNFEKEGERAGDFLLEYYQGINDEIKVVELRGTENSTPALGRASGFRTAIKTKSNIKIVQSYDGDFMKSRGKEIMANVLDSGIEFDVIYSHNDMMTYGVIEALEAHGIQPGKDVVIVSVDGEQKMIELLLQGKVNCVVECTPLFGEKVMEICKAIVNGERVPKVIYSDETLFTMWDDLSSLPARGY